MKFQKTSNTLQAVARLSPEQLGLNEVLAVILDVLDDAKKETGIADFSRLQKNEEAVGKWLAICRAFLGTGIDQDASILSEKKKEKVEKLAASLRDKDQELEKLNNETENLSLQLRSLQRDMDELEAEREKHAETEKRVRSLEREVTALQRDLDSYTVRDPAELEEKIKKLQEQKDISALLSAQMRVTETELSQATQAYKSLTSQSREMEEGLTRTKNDIASETARQESLARQIELNRNLLTETQQKTETLARENEALTEVQIPEAKKALDKMNEENGQYFANLQTLQNDINTKKTLLQESTGELDAVKKLLEELRLSTEQAKLDIESEKENQVREEERNKTLNAELSELRATVGAVISKNEELAGELIPNAQKRLEVLKENREELSRSLVSLDQQVGETDQEIKSQQEKLSQEENLLAEKKEEVEEFHRKIDSVAQQRAAEETTVSDLRTQLESLQEHIEMDKNNGIELQKQLMKQKLLLKTQKEHNDEVLEKIVDEKSELEKAQKAVEDLQAELNDWNRKRQEADASSEEVRTRILESKAILDEVNLKIEQLGEEQQRLIGEINAKRKLLEESKPELLQEQLTSLRTEHAEKNARCDMLQKELTDQKAKLETTERTIADLTRELEDVVNKCAAAMDQKQQAEQKKGSEAALLENLQNDLVEYKAFFASADYQEQEKRIADCKRAKALYEEGVKNLLGRTIPPQFLRVEGKQILQEYSNRLSAQLHDVEERLKSLYQGYIILIQRLEKEVNQYAV